MPKVIKNLKEEILQKGKTILSEKGFDCLTIRAVANECNIAVGTVYNYFSSKETLVANIMLDGWEAELNSIKQKTEHSFTCTLSLKIIFGYLVDYHKLFRSTWDSIAISNEAKLEYQHMLKSGLSELIHSTLLYFGANMSPDPTDFLTEILIFEASKDTVSFDEIEPFITRIVKL